MGTQYEKNIKNLTVCTTILAVFIALLLCSCNSNFKEYTNPENKNRHIIIDSDTGSDDASAIILAAENITTENQ